MNRFIKHITLFIIICFIVDKATYFLVSNLDRTTHDKRLKKVLEGSLNKDLIVLGSSRGGGNILTGQLQKETAITSYNLAYPGTDIYFHKFILTTYLNYNDPPKFLIYNIDNPHMFMDEVFLDFREDYLYPYSAYTIINNKLIEEGHNSWVSKFLYTTRLRRSDLKFKEQIPPKTNPIDNFGSRPILKERRDAFSFKNIRDVMYAPEMDAPDKIKTLREIEYLCKKKGIELVYVFSPDFRHFNERFYNNFLKGVDPSISIFVYDRNNPQFQNDAYFFDESHLNAKGAKIFTSEISDYLNSLNRK